MHPAWEVLLLGVLHAAILQPLKDESQSKSGAKPFFFSILIRSISSACTFRCEYMRGGTTKTWWGLAQRHIGAELLELHVAWGRSLLGSPAAARAVVVKVHTGGVALQIFILKKRR